jgi:hypothetical protein
LYTATLTFTKTDDGRVRLEWADHDPISAFVTADTAEAAVALIAEHGDFSGQWLDQETPELSTPEPEPATLGLARKVAIAPDDIRKLVEDYLNADDLLRIDYRDNEGVVTTGRLIEPKSTFSPSRVSARRLTPGEEYLRAYDYGRGEMRTFRMDRIERVEVVEQ